MKYYMQLLCLAALLPALAGCFGPRQARTMESETQEEVLPADLAEREVWKVENAMMLGTLSPLAVDRAYKEAVRQVHTGQLSYKGVPFFSGMTDQALIRQAVLSWDLALLFERLPRKASIRVAAFPDCTENELFREGLTQLLAANTEKVEVVKADGAYTLLYQPVTAAVYRSWSMKGKTPYLQRYVAAGAFLELVDNGSQQVIFSAPMESSANYIGSFEPLCFLPATRGGEASEMNLPARQFHMVRESGLEGYVFGPENRILIAEAFRDINLVGTGIPANSGIQEGGVAVWLADGEYQREIRSLLVSNNLNVRFSGSDYVLQCRVDYAGVSSLPGEPGRLLRQAVVVFWAELYEVKSGKVYWSGQLVGRSRIAKDFLLFQPLLFPSLNPERDVQKSVVKSL